MLDRFIEVRDTWEPLEVGPTKTGPQAAKLKKWKNFRKKKMEKFQKKYFFSATKSLKAKLPKGFVLI